MKMFKNNIKIEKSAIKKSIWTFGFIGFVLLSISAINFKKSSKISKLNIEITPIDENKFLINERDIIVYLERNYGSNLIGNSLAQISLENLENKIESITFVKEAKVFLDSNNELHFEIEQRKPVLRIVDAEGGNFYLDKSGQKIANSSHYSARVPVATGAIMAFDSINLDLNVKTPKTTGQSLFELAMVINADDFSRALVEQIVVLENNDFILIPKIGTEKILIGKPIGFDIKLKRLKNYYKQATPYQGWNKFKTIDVRYKGQVVCK